MRASTFIIFLTLLSALLSTNVHAKSSDPCDSKNRLKGWAKKAGYTQDECTDGEQTTSNSTPSIAITDPADNSTVEEGTTVTFSGTATDNEDGDLSGNITWNSSLDGSISPTTTLSVGTHTITAAVSDSGGLSASDQIALTVTEAPTNTAPSVTITAPSSNTSVEEGTTVTFSGTASDNEDGDLSGNITWNSSLDGSISPTTTLSVGTHTITAAVSDSGGLSASDQIALTVTEAPTNTAPSVTITAPSSNTSVEEGTTVTFSGTATDNEDGDLSGNITWNSSLDGSINPTTTLSVGTHTITAAVSDSGGLSASDQIALTVTEAPTNTAPSVTITAPSSNTSVEEGTTVTFSGTATDNEEGDLSGNITWNSSLDGSISPTTTLSVGTHTITAAVSDSGGLSASDQIALTVTAPEPTTISVTLSWSIPSTRENGETLEQYEIGGYEVLFKKVGDTLYYSETINDGLTAQHVVSNLEPGDYEFKIAAFDNEGIYSQYTSTSVLVE